MCSRVETLHLNSYIIEWTTIHHNTYSILWSCKLPARWQIQYLNPPKCTHPCKDCWWMSRPYSFQVMTTHMSHHESFPKMLERWWERNYYRNNSPNFGFPGIIVKAWMIVFSFAVTWACSGWLNSTLSNCWAFWLGQQEDCQQAWPLDINTTLPNTTKCFRDAKKG